QKYRGATETRRYQPEERRAQRSADSGRRSNNALGQVEATGAAGDIGDDQRQNDQCGNDERGALFSLVYEILYHKRQHGSVGELKQEQAGAKGEQPRTLPEASQACPRR